MCYNIVLYAGMYKGSDLVANGYEADDLKKVNRRALEAAFDWVSAIVVALAVLVLVMTFMFRVVGVDGESMLPTLHHMDRLVLSYGSADYVPGDIVVVDRYTDEPLIKRVIAVAGDRISITDSYSVYVNGERLEEPYIQGVTIPRDVKDVMVVPEGCIFVMGDNRTISRDSRMDEIGMISVKDVVGKAVFCIWPPQSFGGVYDNLK